MDVSVDSGTGDPVTAYRVRGVVHALEQNSSLGSAGWQAVEPKGTPEISYDIDGTHQVRWRPPLTTDSRFYRMRLALDPDGP